MNAPVATLRQKLGCWLHERWRAELALRVPWLGEHVGCSWLDLCNRSERLRRESGSEGRICDWQDSSTLTVARVFPEVGRRLMRHALARWPIRFDFGPGRAPQPRPDVSILVVVGGADRIPQFELCLAAARAQRDVAFEIVVVEQSPETALAGKLPEDVRYLHQAVAPGQPFNKSRALNAAARAARGSALLLLDADLLMPDHFVRECWRMLEVRSAVRPVRMIFYVSRDASETLVEQRDPGISLALDVVTANAPMPIALRADAYWSVGGHDETYQGWGGEDTEFLDRLRTQDVAEGGWMPLVHTWHPPAGGKASGDRNAGLHGAKMVLPATERIQRMRTKDAPA